MPEVRREQLMAVALESAGPVAEVRAARVTLEPGQATGRHSHPCTVVGTILAGKIQFAIEGEESRLLGSGDAFLEPSGAVIEAFDNASPDLPASFAAFYLLPPGEDRLIEML